MYSGSPGDFNLEFMQQIEDGGVVEWVGTCTELNGAHAADGYARLSGLGGVVVTHGVGALSAIKGVAGAHSEHVPVVRVAGALPAVALERNLLHHTFADGGRGEFLRAYAQVTAATASISPQNAAMEIDRLITTAWRMKRPVYLELPSDVAYLEVEVCWLFQWMPPGYRHHGVLRLEPAILAYMAQREVETSLHAARRRFSAARADFREAGLEPDAIEKALGVYSEDGARLAQLERQVNLLADALIRGVRWRPPSRQPRMTAPGAAAAWDRASLVRAPGESF
ncbi:thiamine pyrophosphate-binding protein [Peterkaempfera sp. SMS 1(5)a]|uniref:thiamine pyrophosphate-binding protein n=1 Tax=Peterkaempfera podocarpi TaxID=3232308 RepID=UPI00366D4547